MSKIIRGEMLKGKRSFGRKSLILFPLLVSGMAIFLMGGELTQIGAYNWWYMLLLPMVVGLVCTNLVDADKRLGFYNCNVLPISPAKMWHGKIWTGLLYLAFSNAVVFGLTTLSGLLFPSQYPLWRGLAAGIILTVTWAWQIPLGLYLAARFHSVVTFLSILFLNIFCSSQSIAGGAFWYVPFAIAPRLMAPIIHINPNGVPLEAGSPLYDAGVVLPGLILTLLFLLASSFLSTRWFSKGGRYRETI